jgi:hypothetical protein
LGVAVLEEVADLVALEAEVVSEVLVVEDSLAEEQVEVGNILKLNNF